MSAFLSLFIFIFPALANAEVCRFQLSDNSIKVGWTAYKTTEKVAVSGSFKNITVTGAKPSKTLSDLVRSVNVSIDPLSMDSGNPGRDITVTENFFKKLAPKISGRIKDFNEAKKEFTLALNFNGKTKDVAMKYDVQNETNFSGIGVFDILNFNGKVAHDSIHKQCFELHKGPDGVSKTWSEVQISISGEIKKICQK